MNEFLKARLQKLADMAPYDGTFVSKPPYSDVFNPPRETFRWDPFDEPAPDTFEQMNFRKNLQDQLDTNETDISRLLEKAYGKDQWDARANEYNAQQDAITNQQLELLREARDLGTSSERVLTNNPGYRHTEYDNLIKLLENAFGDRLPPAPRMEGENLTPEESALKDQQDTKSRLYRTGDDYRPSWSERIQKIVEQRREQGKDPLGLVESDYDNPPARPQRSFGNKLWSPLKSVGKGVGQVFRGLFPHKVKQITG